ncbi:hypothetical protein [Pedococcus dokdonensis]|nr:hypothetical protein [Pedococcus dokdonensis]
MRRAAPDRRPQNSLKDVAGSTVLDPTDANYYAALLAWAEPLLDMDRRRDQAARRLPPLDDGRRDPLGAITDGDSG